MMHNTEEIGLHVKVLGTVADCLLFCLSVHATQGSDNAGQFLELSFEVHPSKQHQAVLTLFETLILAPVL